MNIMEPHHFTNHNLLIGQYSSGQFVLVYGQDSLEKLKRLGHFGEDFEKAKRKEYNRRGPLDRQLTDLIPDTQDEPVSILTMHEAFFLTHALGCLSLHSEGREVSGLISCWSLFRNYYLRSNLKLDFAVEYGVYHYFRSRGWIVKSGTNYGANFLLYKEGPSIDHAQYAVNIICEDHGTCAESNRWNSLLTFHRVIQSVCKELLLVFVVVPNKSNSTFEEPSIISKMKLETRIFTSQSNSLSIKSNAQSSNT